MLTLTDNAVSAIREITSQDEVPDGAVLRIASDPAAGSLMLSLVQEPADGDAVVDSAGARLFLDSQAANLLDDKALDAAMDTAGSVQFTLSEQI